MARAILKERIIKRNNLPTINTCSSAKRLKGAGEGLMGTWIDGIGCRTQEDPCKHATWVCTGTDGTEGRTQEDPCKHATWVSIVAVTHTHPHRVNK